MFNLETDDVDIFTIGTTPANTVKKQAVNFPTPAQNIEIVDASNAVVAYLAGIVTKTDGDLQIVNYNTLRVLNSTITPAPSPLPPTDKTAFEVVVNATYIPNNLITSVTQNGSNVDIVIDTASLGYNLNVIEDLTSVSVIGKFS